MAVSFSLSNWRILKNDPCQAFEPFLSYKCCINHFYQFLHYFIIPSIIPQISLFPYSFCPSLFLRLSFTQNKTNLNCLFIYLFRKQVVMTWLQCVWFYAWVVKCMLIYQFCYICVCFPFVPLIFFVLFVIRWFGWLSTKS